MIRLLFLIPLILCLLWITYLATSADIAIRDGKQGFIYIFIFSTVYSRLLYVDDRG